MLRDLEVSVPCFWCPEPPWEKSRLLRCGERPCRGDCGHPAAWLTKASWTTSPVNRGMTPALATIWLWLRHSPAGQPTEPWEKVANCCFKPLYWHRTILKQTGFLLICLVLPLPLLPFKSNSVRLYSCPSTSVSPTYADSKTADWNIRKKLCSCWRVLCS